MMMLLQQLLLIAVLFATVNHAVKVQCRKVEEEVSVGISSSLCRSTERNDTLNVGLTMHSIYGMECLLLTRDVPSNEDADLYFWDTVEGKPTRQHMNALTRLMMYLNLQQVIVEPGRLYDRSHTATQTGNTNDDDVFFKAYTTNMFVKVMNTVGIDSLPNELFKDEIDTLGCVQGVRIEGQNRCIYGVQTKTNYTTTTARLNDICRKVLITDYDTVVSPHIHEAKVLDVKTADELEGLLGYIKLYNPVDPFVVKKMSYMESDKFVMSRDNVTKGYKNFVVVDPILMTVYKGGKRPNVVLCTDPAFGERAMAMCTKYSGIYPWCDKMIVPSSINNKKTAAAALLGRRNKRRLIDHDDVYPQANQTQQQFMKYSRATTYTNLLITSIVVVCILLATIAIVTVVVHIYLCSRFTKSIRGTLPYTTPLLPPPHPDVNVV